MVGDLTRGHPVSLRRQLAVGIEAAIRDGHLRPGDRLPSTRDLSVRSGLSRGTVNAAYARLRRRGCVAGGTGGRLRVVGSLAGARDPACAADLARAGLETALAGALRLGVTREAVLRAFGEALAPAPDRARRTVQPVYLFEPRRGLRESLAAELEWRLGLPVEASGRPTSLRPPVLVREGVLASGRWRFLEVIPLSLTGGTRERGIVRRGVRRGLVTLVSVSHTVRRYARELAARDFERGISFVAVDPRDAPAVVRLVAASRLVLFDEASRDRLPSTSAPTVPVWLLPAARIAALRLYLGAPEPRRGT